MATAKEREGQLTCSVTKGHKRTTDGHATRGTQTITSREKEATRTSEIDGITGADVFAGRAANGGVTSSQFKSPWRTSLSASSLPSGPCNHHRSGKRLIWRAEGRDFAARCAGPPRSLRGRGCGPGSKWRPRAKEESVEETIARLITVACALTAHDAAAHAPRPLFLSSRPPSSERQAAASI